MSGKTTCMLDAAEGRSVRCPGEQCPFWEKAGFDRRDGCALERLGLRVDDPDHARYFLDERALVLLLRTAGETT